MAGLLIEDLRINPYLMRFSIFEKLSFCADCSLVVQGYELKITGALS